MSNKTEIIVEKDMPAIRIVREFDATPDKVFRAWVDPELFVRWIGPRSIDTRVDAWDASTGGRWAYTAMRDGEQVAGFYGSFHEVRAGERLVQTFTYDGAPDGVALETMVFEALAGGRTRVTSLSITDDYAARDAMVASGMETGIHEGYEKLDDLLETL